MRDRLQPEGRAGRCGAGAGGAGARLRPGRRDSDRERAGEAEHEAASEHHVRNGGGGGGSGYAEVLGLLNASLRNTERVFIRAEASHSLLKAAPETK